MARSTKPGIHEQHIYYGILNITNIQHTVGLQLISPLSVFPAESFFLFILFSFSSCFLFFL